MRERHNDKFTDYINELFAPEDEVLQQIRLSLRQDGKEGINVGPHEGKILQLLTQLIGARKVVEVGTLYGYSAVWIARGLPADGKLICLEYDEDNYQKAKSFIAKSDVADKVSFVLGDAAETLQQLSSESPFDMIFIDANKAAYEKYLDWAEENIRTGGLIIGDNTFLFGNVIEKQSDNISEKQIEVMKSFNKRLSNTQQYNSVLLPTVEGMTIAQKK